MEREERASIHCNLRRPGRERDINGNVRRGSRQLCSRVPEVGGCILLPRADLTVVQKYLHREKRGDAKELYDLTKAEQDSGIGS